MKAVTVDSLDYSYDKLNVLSKVSFNVETESFFSIIGPNGSGKSTLMKILAGILKYKKGEIFISGKSLENYSKKELARHTAYVSQNVAAEFPFTVEEIVLLGRAPHQGLLGMHSEYDQKTVEHAMEITDIVHLAARRIDQVSGGERQRVLIARAICQEPEIMLLDEPASALDLAHQIQLMDLLEKLKHKTGITIIMISHDINLAAMYADSMILINNGMVVKSGTPCDVLESKILKKTFGCSFLIDSNPLGNFPRIFPVPARYNCHGQS